MKSSVGIIAISCAVVLAACKSDASDSAAVSLNPATLAGQWAFAGFGLTARLSKTYTFLSDGTFVLETTYFRRTDQASANEWVPPGNSVVGKWQASPEAIILVQEHRRVVGLEDDPLVVTRKVEAKLSADAKQLTLRGEDGDCADANGVKCTRVYERR